MTTKIQICCGIIDNMRKNQTHDEDFRQKRLYKFKLICIVIACIFLLILFAFIALQIDSKNSQKNVAHQSKPPLSDTITEAPGVSNNKKTTVDTEEVPQGRTEKEQFHSETSKREIASLCESAGKERFTNGFSIRKEIPELNFETHTENSWNYKAAVDYITSTNIAMQTMTMECSVIKEGNQLMVTAFNVY